MHEPSTPGAEITFEVCRALSNDDSKRGFYSTLEGIPLGLVCPFKKLFETIVILSRLLFICLFEKNTEKKRELLSVDLLPEGYGREGWARPKPATTNSFGASRLGDRDPSQLPELSLLPPKMRVSRKLESGVKPGLEPGHLMWDVSVPGGIFISVPNAYPQINIIL